MQVRSDELQTHASPKGDVADESTTTQPLRRDPNHVRERRLALIEANRGGSDHPLRHQYRPRAPSVPDVVQQPPWWAHRRAGGAANDITSEGPRSHRFWRYGTAQEKIPLRPGQIGRSDRRLAKLAAQGKLDAPTTKGSKLVQQEFMPGAHGKHRHL